MKAACSLGTAIQEQLLKAPDRVFTRFLHRGEREFASLNGAAIDEGARRVAGGLIAHGLSRKLVILAFDTGPGFLQVLLGCFYANVVAIPAPRPRPGIAAERLDAIAAASGATAILTSKDLRDRLRGAGGAADALAILTLDDLLAEAPAAVCPGLAADAKSRAIIQYTSGSTGRPRGVVLTGACVLDNIARASQGMNLGRDGMRETWVNWMPHHHDMGLIGMILIPLVNGLEVVHMSPLSFVQKPSRWLEAISRYRARVSGGPSFAYDLCTRQVSDECIDRLDLECWEVAYCGAEPVFTAGLDAFRRRFARAGLAPGAVFAVYGLAETSLYAAGSPPVDDVNAAARWNARAPCHLDRAARESIRVVDQAHRAQADGCEGEIWISSPSVAAGYLGDEKTSAATFYARTDPDDGRNYLRTGDVGRIEGDALIVSGRIKDIVIRAGVNVAAADIERFGTQCSASLNPHRAAAFEGPDEAGAPLVLLVERRRAGGDGIDDDQLVRKIRRAVFDGAGVAVDEVCILRPGTLPRTTSGKIMRFCARLLWLESKSNLSKAVGVPA